MLFGSTGDLAYKKLFPALYELTVAGVRPRIIGVARSEHDDESLRARIRDSLKGRDPERALVHARKALELNAESSDAWSVLGFSLFRLQRWTESIEALERARELEIDTDGASVRPSCFFLAMAHAKLGDADTAREWFEKGASWGEVDDLNKERLQQLQAEAAEVLGIERR